MSKENTRLARSLGKTMTKDELVELLSALLDIAQQASDGRGFEHKPGDRHLTSSYGDRWASGNGAGVLTIIAAATSGD